jgi:hypothetical protein
MNLLMSHALGGDWPPAVRRLVAELCAKCQGCRSARRTRVYFRKGLTAEKTGPALKCRRGTLPVLRQEVS